MAPSPHAIEQLARAVLDGESVDWSAVESSVAGGDAPLLRQLRTVESIALHLRAASVDALPLGGYSAAPRAPLPEFWGQLRILEQVGQGSFGAVFRAWDARLDREVALKLLPATSDSVRDVTPPVICEGRLLAKVRHPNVVTVYGAEQIGDEVGLWMEFVRGQTLAQILQSGTAFDADDVIATGVELAGAVSAVHAAGLLHRDIKAQNVTRADDGRIVLMDFGTGREQGEGAGTDLAGTPLYLAPEVLAGEAASVRSDIYSLGVLLYFLLAGSYPVHARSVDEVRRAHLRNERTELRVVRPDLPRALVRVIARAIDPEPTRRYADARALARDLMKASPRPHGRSLVTAAALAVVALVAVLASGWNVGVGDDPRETGDAIHASLAAASRIVEHPRILVLPFRNSSGDAGSSRLIDSLTAGLVKQLAIIDGLHVKSQASSFMLKDKPHDLIALGRQLGVNLVIDGEARVTSGTVTISAALVSTSDQRRLWSETVARPLNSEADVVAVVEELTRTTVNRLRLKLGRTQRRYESVDLATLEQYLRGRELRDMRLGKGREAIPLFEDVIRRDPSYAPAYAALAATYGDLTMSWPNPDGYAIAPPEALRKMTPLTERALEIDPMLAEAHVSQAYMHALQRRWAEAEASFQYAIDLDPTITAAYGDFVLSTLEPWGRLRESIDTLKAALEVDPLSLDLRNVLSRIQLSAGDYDEALANCRHVVAIDPDFPFAEEYCARALAAKGRTDEALALFNKRPSLNEHGIAYIYAITGRRDKAKLLAEHNIRYPNRQALIFAALGDKDRAFEALARLAVQNPRRAGAYLNYPELASLRSDPRAAALRRQLGFPAS